MINSFYYLTENISSLFIEKIKVKLINQIEHTNMFHKEKNNRLTAKKNNKLDRRTWSHRGPKVKEFHDPVFEFAGKLQRFILGLR